MNKIIAIIGANLLIAGGLSARAGWMIYSGCTIGGTCRGTSDMLTWGLAIGPAVILLAVIGMSVPKLLKASAERRAEKKVLAAERAEVAAEEALTVEHSNDRLARMKKAQEARLTMLEDEYVAPLPLDDSDDGAGIDADAGQNADVWPADVWPVDAMNVEGLADTGAVAPLDDAAAIEREWQAAEATMDSSAMRYIAESHDVVEPSGELPLADVPEPVFARFGEPADWSVEANDNADTSGEIEPTAAAGDRFRLTPLMLDDMGEDACEEGAFDDGRGDADADTASLSLKAFAALPAIEPEAHAGAPVAGHDWRLAGVDAIEAELAGDAEPAQNWTAPAPFPTDASDGHSYAPASDEFDESRFPSISAAKPAASIGGGDYAPIDLPVIGQAAEEWSWLFADGLPLLRTSRATGFPWIAGGIGEVANAIQLKVALDQIGNFSAEVEAWSAIARSMPYAEIIDGADAQAFVEWCNTLSVDLAASGQQPLLMDAIAEAMVALRGRARNDMETSLALPDAFDQRLPGSSFGSASAY